MSDSVWPHRWQPTRLPCPWDSPGKNTGVGCRFLLQCMKVKRESEFSQSCPTLSDPMDCSLPGASIHGIFQARVLEWGDIAFSEIFLWAPFFWRGETRILEWVTIPFSRIASWPRDWTRISCIVSSTLWATLDPSFNHNKARTQKWKILNVVFVMCELYLNRNWLYRKK